MEDSQEEIVHDLSFVLIGGHKQGEHVILGKLILLGWFDQGLLFNTLSPSSD